VHKVIAVQLPLHSLADDIATVKRAIDLVGGPVILVGHSYGGFVITNAAYNNPNVKGLVYIAAFAPNEGQSLSNFVDLKKFPKGFLVFDNGGFVYINPEVFGQAFAQDVDPAQAKVMAAAQKPFSQSILAEKSGPSAWKQLPSWYQVSENDHAIPPDVERMFAKQINATTISLVSSHVFPLSHPNGVAQLILNATKGAKEIYYPGAPHGLTATHQGSGQRGSVVLPEILDVAPDLVRRGDKHINRMFVCAHRGGVGERDILVLRKSV
jgi:pimeloyl-ACP methyl ester carboxylesterase